jgi:hypothetical protein
MRKSDILKIKPIKTKKSGEIITVQLAGEDQFLLLYCYKEKTLIGRYLMRLEDCKHEAWMNGKWQKKKLSSVFGYTTYYGSYDFMRKAKIDGILDKKIVEILLKHHHSDYLRAIDDMESDYNYKQASNANDRKAARIDALMDLVQALPQGFETWCNRVIFKDAEYMFYDKKADSYFCTACNEVHKIDGLKHNMPCRCPASGKDIIVKRRQHEIMIRDSCMVVQSIDENRSVARHFTVEKCWKDAREIPASKRESSFREYEEIRLILHKGQLAGKVEIYYGQGWLKDEFEQDWWTSKNNKYFNMEYCYPEGCQEALKHTVYANLGIHVMAEKGWKLQYNKVMANYYNCACMEYMVKGNYERLTSESSDHFSNWGGSYGMRINLTGKTIQEVLRIDLQRAHRLRQNNGGEIYLRWLRWESVSGRNLPEATIHWMEGNKIEPDDIAFISDRMSPVQVANYMRRQMEASHKKIHWLFDTWKDYLSMTSRVKMDVTNELIYRPKDLIKAHDDMVLLIEQNDAAIKAEELLSKYPLVNDICAEIKEKYEYGDETYSVVVPKGFEDIIVEGKILRHCMDKTERYFDRINQRETYILFLRRADDIEKPYYTLEVEPNGTVRQKRTLGDKQNPDIEDAKKFLSRWQKEVQKRITEEDKKLSDESRRLRIDGYRQLREKKEKVWNGVHAGELLADVLEADLMEVG